MKFLTQRKSLVLGASFAAMAAALTLGAPAFAADTATLQGHVASAAAGAKIQVINASTGERAEGTVRADGSYVIIGLRPGTYHVVVGGNANQDVTLAVGETTTLDLDAAAAPPAKDVVVTASRRKEVRTSEVATSVSQTQIQNLPQNGRNFMNFAALAPGVSVSTDPERKTFQGGATYANQVNVFIDGQSQKNQVLQGGVAGQDSSRGNPFPQLAIQEFKVSTQNFKAEFEQAGTAIISAVTKTGGNEFHGTVFADYQSKDMIGQPFYQRNTPKGDYQNKEYGFDVGGPIVKDLLHFYVSYEGREDQRPTDPVLMPTGQQLIDATPGATPTQQASLNALGSALAAENGTFPKDFKQDMWFGKLTYTPTDDDTVDLTFMDRKEDDIRDFSGTTAHSHGSNQNQHIQEGSVNWKHRWDNILNEAVLEYQKYDWAQSPLTNQPGINLIGTTTSYNTVALLGGATYSQEKAQENVTLRDNVTFTGIEWNGQHVIKTGIKVAQYKYLATENDHFNPEFFYVASDYTYGGSNNVPVRVTISDGNPEINSKNTQIGLFIQDDWTYDAHWTFNLGIRWDYESNMLNDKFVTDPSVAAAIRGFTNFKNGGFNPEDYISDGHNRKPFYGAFQPRLGFSYDVNGDRTTVIFGGYGRYYDRTIFDDAQLETRRTQLHVTSLDFGSGASQIPWNSSYFNDPSALVAAAKAKGLKGEIYALNNDAKVPYSDQFNIGVRHQFGAVATSVTLSDIESKDIFSFVLGNRNPDGSWCSYGPQYACQPWSYGLPGYGNFIISSNEQHASYRAIYLTADKPYTKASHYGYSGTLTLTDAKATGHNDRFIFDYATPNDSGEHAAEGVDKMRFVGTGIVDGPWKTRVSGILTLASGAPFDYIDASGPATRIIPGGIFPKNKLAFKQFDMRIAKDIDLPNGQTVTLDAQVYNLFDWVNKTYSGWGGGFNGGSGATGAGDTNTQGPARSFQVGLTYHW